MRKVKIFDSAFTPFGKSASLREDNKDVGPTHFEWENDGNNPTFYTDGHIGHYRDIPIGENIVWLLEPRCLRPENYKLAKSMHDKGHIKTILTYDKQLLDECSNARFYPFGGSSIALDKFGVPHKKLPERVCMFVSDKETTEGHKLRHEIIKQGWPIDFYGAGVGKPVENKFDVLKKYHSCIVVESCKTDFYFSEKLIDALSVGCFVYYWGCPSIENFFDMGSIFTFNNITELGIYLGPTKNQYYSYMVSNIYNNIENAKKYRICEDFIYETYPDLFGGVS